MAYVMLSRVESIDQLYILESLNETKIYGNSNAIKELRKMKKMSVNQKPSVWNNLNTACTRISSLNCGSLRHQLPHIKEDTILNISDVICFTETWLWENEDTSRYKLDGYKAHHLAMGKGKGISVYYRESKFRHIEDVTTEKIQLTKLSGKSLDLIAVYKAPKGNNGML